MANKREAAEDFQGVRYVDIKALMKYTALGRATAERIAAEAGARRKVGEGPRGRVIYDLDAIDKHLAALQQ